MALANGFPVDFSGEPSGWSSYPSFWDLYWSVRSVNAAYPLNQVAITRQAGVSPLHFDVLVDFAANGDWTLHYVFGNPLNPKFSIDASAHANWYWTQVEATRSLRSAIVLFLSEHMARVDSIVFTVLP